MIRFILNAPQQSDNFGYRMFGIYTVENPGKNKYFLCLSDLNRLLSVGSRF
jgi:hypothetical protein